MKLTKILPFALCFLFLKSADVKFAKADDSKASDAKTDVFSGNDQENKLRYDGILKERSKLISSLISTVQQGDGTSVKGTKFLAIKLLGELRAIEAVPVLLDNLLFSPKDYIFDSLLIPSEYYYVSAIAIWKIGQSSDTERGLIYKIQRAKSKEELELASWVLREIQGKERVIDTLTQYSDSASGQDKQNLLQASSYLKTYKQAPPRIPALKPREEINRELFEGVRPPKK